VVHYSAPSFVDVGDDRIAYRRKGAEWPLHKGMTIFAEQVIPNFRDADCRPVWAREDPAGHQTNAESAARSEDPSFVPEARIAGFGALDVRTAHVDELRVQTRA
jgi:hypothetical protein